MHADDGNDNQKGSIDSYCTGFDSDDDNNNKEHDGDGDDDYDDGDELAGYEENAAEWKEVKRRMQTLFKISEAANLQCYIGHDMVEGDENCGSQKYYNHKPF